MADPPDGNRITFRLLRAVTPEPIGCSVPPRAAAILPRPHISSVTKPPTRPGLQIESLAYGLAGLLAHPPAVRPGSGHTRDCGTPSSLLDYLVPLALEISRGSGLCPSDRATSYSVGFLCPGRARLAQPSGTRLGSAHWTHSGLYL